MCPATQTPTGTAWALPLEAATNPPGTPTHVPIGGLTLNAGETVGIYWTTTDTGVRYTNGPLGAYENAHLRFEDRGTGNEYPFSVAYSPRVWNGTVYYQTAGQSCPATFDVYLDTVNPPVTQVCTGLTAPTCDPPAARRTGAIRRLSGLVPHGS